MSKRKIFISYSRADVAYVTKLVTALRKRDMVVWFDKNIRSGHQWDSTIEREIKAADVMVVVLSQSSVKSSNVLDEVSYAISLNKLIVPVKVAECEVPMRLARYQYIDFTQGLETGVDQLITDLSYETERTTGTAEQIVPQIAPLNTKRQKKYSAAGVAAVVVAILLGILFATGILPKYPNTESNGTGSTADTLAVKELQDLPWNKAMERNTVDAYITYIKYNGSDAAHFEDAKKAIDSLLPMMGNVIYRNEKRQVTFTGQLFFTETGSLENTGDGSGRVPRKGDILMANRDMPFYTYVDEPYTDVIEGESLQGGQKVKVIEMQPVKNGNTVFMIIRYGKQEAKE